MISRYLTYRKRAFFSTAGFCSRSFSSAGHKSPQRQQGTLLEKKISHKAGQIAAIYVFNVFSERNEIIVIIA